MEKWFSLYLSHACTLLSGVVRTHVRWIEKVVELMADSRCVRKRFMNCSAKSVSAAQLISVADQ